MRKRSFTTDHVPPTPYKGSKRDIFTLRSNAAPGSIMHMIDLSGQPKKFFVQVIEQAALDGVPECQRFIMALERLHPDEQDGIDFDIFCAQIKLRPSMLVGVFVESVCRHKQLVANYQAAMVLDDVVGATYDNAMRPNGTRDREILLRNQKFVEERSSSPLVTIDQRKIEISGSQKAFEQVIKGQLNEPTNNLLPASFGDNRSVLGLSPDNAQDNVQDNAGGKQTIGEETRQAIEGDGNDGD